MSTLLRKAQCFLRVAKQIAQDTQTEAKNLEGTGRTPLPILSVDDVLTALSRPCPPPVEDRRAWVGFARRIHQARLHMRRLLVDRWHADDAATTVQEDTSIDVGLAECLVELLLSEIDNVTSNDNIVARWRSNALSELGYPRG
jgi:hypothetical protein